MDVSHICLTCKKQIKATVKTLEVINNHKYECINKLLRGEGFEEMIPPLKHMEVLASKKKLEEDLDQLKIKIKSLEDELLLGQLVNEKLNKEKESYICQEKLQDQHQSQPKPQKQSQSQHQSQPLPLQQQQQPQPQPQQQIQIQPQLQQQSQIQIQIQPQLQQQLQLLHQGQQEIKHDSIQITRLDYSKKNNFYFYSEDVQKMIHDFRLVPTVPFTLKQETKCYFSVHRCRLGYEEIKVSQQELDSCLNDIQMIKLLQEKVYFLGCTNKRRSSPIEIQFTNQLSGKIKSLQLCLAKHVKIPLYWKNILSFFELSKEEEIRELTNQNTPDLLIHQCYHCKKPIDHSLIVRSTRTTPGDNILYYCTFACLYWSMSNITQYNYHSIFSICKQKKRKCENFNLEYDDGSSNESNNLDF